MAEYAKRRGADIGTISVPTGLSSIYQPQAPTAPIPAQMVAPQMVSPVTQQAALRTAIPNPEATPPVPTGPYAPTAPMPPAAGYMTSGASIPNVRFPTAGGDSLRAQLGGAPVLSSGMPARREPGGVPVSVNPFASPGMPAARAAAPMADRAAQMTGGAQMSGNLPRYTYSGDAFAKLPPGQQALIDAEIRRKMMGQAFAGQQQAAPVATAPQQQLPALGIPTKMR